MSLCRDGQEHCFTGRPYDHTPTSWCCGACGLVLTAGEMEMRTTTFGLKEAIARIESELSDIRKRVDKL